MTITPHTLANENSVEELALLMVGEPKSGKSWLSATAPGTIFYFDFDLRLAALRSHPNAKNIFGISFSDPTDSKTMPTAMSEAFNILNKIEASPRLSSLHEAFKNSDRVIDTIVLDSIQTISAAARNYVLYNAAAGDGISRNFAIGNRVVRVPKSYTAWGGEMESTTALVLQARALLHCTKCWKSLTSWTDASGIYRCIHTSELVPGSTLRNPNAAPSDHEAIPRAMNVIVTLHEAPEEDPRSTDSNPIYTGKVVVYPVRYRTLLVYFNEVWRLTRERGRIPTVVCDPDGKFIQAATALGLPPNVAFPPDIKEILNRAKSTQLKPTQKGN